MKKATIGFLLGGGLIYGTLTINPALLCNAPSIAGDSISVTIDSAKATTVEPTILVADDTSKVDTAK